MNRMLITSLALVALSSGAVRAAPAGKLANATISRPDTRFSSVQVAPGLNEVFAVLEGSGLEFSFEQEVDGVSVIGSLDASGLSADVYEGNLHRGSFEVLPSGEVYLEGLRGLELSTSDAATSPPWRHCYPFPCKIRDLLDPFGLALTPGTVVPIDGAVGVVIHQSDDDGDGGGPAGIRIKLDIDISVAELIQLIKALLTK